jgi:uncharacterized protein (TIGR00369 family)
MTDHGVEPENFQALTGYRIAEWRAGFAVVEMMVSRRHGNRSGSLHGGMATTLLDVACARAATFSDDPDKPLYVATLSLTVNFLRPISSGLVRAIGRTMDGGRRIITCRGELLNEKDKPIAVCQGVFRYRDGSEAPRKHA